MDRVPIEQVSDKPEPTETTPPIPVGTAPDKGLSEMQDLNELSAMFGFNEPGFDGMGKEAENIYQWGREMSGESGTAALNTIKKAIEITGINSTGKELMVKLNRWIKLDSRIMAIQKQKELLHG